METNHHLEEIADTAFSDIIANKEKFIDGEIMSLSYDLTEDDKLQIDCFISSKNVISLAIYIKNDNKRPGNYEDEVYVDIGCSKVALGSAIDKVISKYKADLKED